MNNEKKKSYSCYIEVGMRSSCFPFKFVSYYSGIFEGKSYVLNVLWTSSRL